MTDEEFRHLARHACDEFFTGKISLRQWADFEKRLSFVSTSGGAQALGDHVGGGGEGDRRRQRCAAAALPERPAGGGPGR